MSDETRIVVDLPSGEEFEMVISSPTCEIKTVRDTLPTVTFGYTPLSILDIPYVVEKLMSMHVVGLQTISAAARRAVEKAKKS